MLHNCEYIAVLKRTAMKVFVDTVAQENVWSNIESLIKAVRHIGKSCP